jgi:putative oxidoreductase
VFGIFGDVGALVLIAFLIPTSYYMHAYWKIDDPQERAGQSAQFWKNIALIGGALILFWVFNQGQGGLPLTLTDPLFDRW